jgi:hypothetical protein
MLTDRWRGSGSVEPDSLAFMALTCLRDAISLLVDVIALVGVPTLAWNTWKLRKDFRKDRAEEAERRTEAKHQEIVSQGCLEFLDTGEKVAINLVALKKVTGLPRPGDLVMLPGETHNRQTLGAGEYEVERVSFGFQEAPEVTDQPCPAVPSKIIVYVRRNG